VDRYRPAQSTLTNLIAPCSVDRFFRSHWGRRALVVHRNKRTPYPDLPTVAEFEFLLGSLTAPSEGWFSLVKGAAERPRRSALTHDGLLDLPQIYNAVGQGYTLLLTKLHKRHRGTGDLCRNLEMDFFERGALLIRSIGANAYFTPRSAQGFAPHYDDHDVFVLQLAGRKNWRIYRRVIDSPLQPPMRSLEQEEIGKPIHEFLLCPGDFAYIPRGVAHEACTSDSLSLHLTLSIYPATWRDILSRVLVEDARFRRNLPLTFACGGKIRREHSRKLQRVAGLLASCPAITQAIADVASHHLQDSDIPPGNALEQVGEPDPMTPATKLRLAAGVRARVEVDGSSVTLHLPGMRISANATAERAFRRIARGAEFRASDVGLVEEESKVALLTELLHSGYVIRSKARARSV
jgi:ribosomal protein L16 Arg81 hydroxylase